MSDKQEIPPALVSDALRIEQRFPTFWWEASLWELLRLSSRQQRVIEGVADTPILKDGEKIMNDRQVIIRDLKYLRHLRQLTQYNVRIEEAKIEANDDPVGFDRLLYIEKGPNKLTNELFTALWRWPKDIILHYKAKYARARPFQLDPWLQPGLDLPGHPSFPSGHSTQYHMVGLVMDQVTGNRTDLGGALMWMAGRVAQNREFAGLHFPTDTDAGFHLAGKLVPFFVDEHKELIKRARQEEWGIRGDFALDAKRLAYWLKHGVVRDPPYWRPAAPTLDVVRQVFGSKMSKNTVESDNLVPPDCDGISPAGPTPEAL